MGGRGEVVNDRTIDTASITLLCMVSVQCTCPVQSVAYNNPANVTKALLEDNAHSNKCAESRSSLCTYVPMYMYLHMYVQCT